MRVIVQGRYPAAMADVRPPKRSATSCGNRIRLVTIGGYDHGPCIGPHLASTGAIGRFRITSSRYQDGILRICFKRRR